jgi:sugar lactone lactonase YvrE
VTAPLEIGAARCVAPLGAVLGEGPLYDPRDEALYSLDIKGGKIFRTDLETEETVTIAVPGMVSALALAKSGGFVCATQHGFARLTIQDGAARIAPVADPESDLPGNRFNDGKADPLGGFWAGTMDDSEKSVTGAWWRLAPDGAVTKVDAGYHVTNGPAFDPARKRVFLTDSAKRTVFVAQTDGASISNKRVFLQFGEADGYPDGMEIDAEGCLWVAFWDGWAVRRFSPDGELLLEAKMPVPRPTSIAFAGGKMFVTSASVGLAEAAIRKAPLSGGLFCMPLSQKLECAARYVEDVAFA